MQDKMVEGEQVYHCGASSKDASDILRGRIVKKLMLAFYRYNTDIMSEFEDKYFSKGVTVLEISYDENLVIEYVKDVKKYFYFVKENEKYCYFDVYTID